MNGGISDYCHPCSSADSVMLMLIPPFGSADGGDVALLSHLLAGVATDVCAFHQQVLILTVHNAHPCPRRAEARALPFLLMDWQRRQGIAQTRCPVSCHAHWHMEILHTWSLGEGIYAPALFACPWSLLLMWSRRGSLRMCVCVHFRT